MIQSAEDSANASNEAYFLAYSARVSKMNGWQLVEELARRVELLDQLNDEVERVTASEGSPSEIEKAERQRDRVGRQIEILQRRTQSANRG